MLGEDGNAQHVLCINGDEDKILDSAEGFQTPQPRTEQGLAALQIVKFMQVGFVKRVALSDKAKHKLINRLEKNNKIDRKSAKKMHKALAKLSVHAAPGTE